MASALDTVRAALEAALVTAWAAAGYAPATLTFGNTSTKARLPFWARMEVVWGDGPMLTMEGDGAGANEVYGVVMVNVFAPTANGTGVLTQASDVVRNCFNRKAFGLCRCLGPSGPSAKPDPEDPSWFMVTIRVPFRVIDLM